MTSAKQIDISKPRYDQSTYWGRVRHFAGVIDPLTLLTTDAQLKKYQQILADHKAGTLPASVSVDEIWNAKRVVDAIVHPDTKEKVFLPFRMASFVPTNIPIVVGMIGAKSPAGVIFWQWINQSYNVAVNHANRNASNSMSLQQIGTAYAAAVASSCTIAVGLNKIAANLQKSATGSRAGMIGLAARTLVPYTAVASAGALNVVLMRMNEGKEGVGVKDSEGNTLGTSQIAGKKAIFQTMLTRIALPAPVLIVPALAMSGLERAFPVVKANPRVRVPLEIAVVTASLWGALPLAIGLFPQVVQVPAKELEPKFHNLKDKNGKAIETVFFNKGL